MTTPSYPPGVQCLRRLLFVPLCNILRGHDETPFNYYPKQTPASVLNDRHIGNPERYRLTEGLFWIPRQPRQEKETFEGVSFQNKRWYPEKNSKTEERTWDEKQWHPQSAEYPNSRPYTIPPLFQQDRAAPTTLC